MTSTLPAETVCASPTCSTPATLRCPTCLALEISIPNVSHFCSQQCFKTSWPTHKKLHGAPPLRAPDPSLKRRRAAYNGYEFTGPLRPGEILLPIRTVPQGIVKPDYAKTGFPAAEEKFNRSSTAFAILDEDEIEAMRTVCRLGREVLDIAVRACKPGVTTEEVDKIVHDACVERDSYPSPLNYYGFPKSCCTSVNEVICHGIPDSRPLEDGDVLNIDITLYHNGHHGDLNETIIVGEGSKERKKLVRCAYDALWAAIKQVRPGTLIRELGTPIEKIVKSNSHSVVRSYCGHGIGRQFHTAPNVPHYRKNKAVGMCKKGMVFTIEPMVNVGGWRDDLWPDQWTAVTADGSDSAQFEHTVLVTEDGCEVLTARVDDGPKFWWEQ